MTLDRFAALAMTTRLLCKRRVVVDRHSPLFAASRSDFSKSSPVS